MTRRHDIDALRALAFALLIVYHWCMLYVAGDDWDWHLKSTHLAEWLQVPMLLVNRWRMDLVFLVSGLSVHFLLRGTSIGRFVAMRSWRLLLPLVFGMWVVVPVQPYIEGVANGLVAPGFLEFLPRYYGHTTWPEGAFAGWEHGFTWNHLWYLAYLWIYTLAFAALLPLLRSRAGLAWERVVHGLRGWKLMLLPAVPIAIETLLLQPHFESTGDFFHDWYRNALFFTVFLYGWWLGNDNGLWAEIARLRGRTLAVAAGLFAFYLGLVMILPEDIPAWLQNSVWLLRSVYVWSALCAILGWAHVLLNRPFRWLPWANASVFPWYVLHQSLIVLIAWWLLPLHLGAITESLLVLAGTVAGCWGITTLVSRVAWLRPCFGMKSKPRSAMPTAGVQAAKAGRVYVSVPRSP